MTRATVNNDILWEVGRLLQESPDFASGRATPIYNFMLAGKETLRIGLGQLGRSCQQVLFQKNGIAFMTRFGWESCVKRGEPLYKSLEALMLRASRFLAFDANSDIPDTLEDANPDTFEISMNYFCLKQYIRKKRKQEGATERSLSITRLTLSGSEYEYINVKFYHLLKGLLFIRAKYLNIDYWLEEGYIIQQLTSLQMDLDMKNRAAGVEGVRIPICKYAHFMTPVADFDFEKVISKFLRIFPNMERFDFVVTADIHDILGSEAIIQEALEMVHHLGVYVYVQVRITIHCYLAESAGLKRVFLDNSYTEMGEILLKEGSVSPKACDDDRKPESLTYAIIVDFDEKYSNPTMDAALFGFPCRSSP